MLGQAEFAEELDLSFSTVNRWENNKSTPNYQTLKKIKDFCDKNGVLFEILEDIDESRLPLLSSNLFMNKHIVEKGENH